MGSLRRQPQAVRLHRFCSPDTPPRLLQQRMKCAVVKRWSCSYGVFNLDRTHFRCPPEVHTHTHIHTLLRTTHEHTTFVTHTVPAASHTISGTLEHSEHGSVVCPTTHATPPRTAASTADLRILRASRPCWWLCERAKLEGNTWGEQQQRKGGGEGVCRVTQPTCHANHGVATGIIRVD